MNGGKKVAQAGQEGAGSKPCKTLQVYFHSLHRALGLTPENTQVLAASMGVQARATSFHHHSQKET